MRLRRTKPMFLSTGKIPITIYRYDGSGEYIKGVWHRGEPEEVIREVNIQPLGYHELLLLPESQRTRQWYNLWCAEDLYTSQEEGRLPDGTETEGREADEFYYEGYLYKIMKVHHYCMGVLDHYHAKAARIEVTPDGDLYG